MKTKNQTGIILLLLLVLFNIFFWREKLAVNLFIFFILLAASLFWSFPKLIKSKTALTTLLFTFCTAATVVINNTHASKISFFIVLAVAVGFTHQVALQSSIYAFANSALNLLATPLNCWKEIKNWIHHYPALSGILKYHKYIYIPVATAFVFLIIYLVGDPQFFESTSNLLINIDQYLSELLTYFSMERIGFLLLGTILLAAVFLSREFHFLVSHQIKHPDFLARKKRTETITHQPKDNYGLFSPLFQSPLALKNEYRNGTITLLLLNLLLLCVNCIDVVKVWIEGKNLSYIYLSERYSVGERSVAVHEGTNTIIFSILLASALLIFFFRGNLNFYCNNRLLKQLALLWIIQNVVLAFTVALRDYYYIHDFGLTEKRIGVMVFLIMTLIGLGTMIFKIAEKRSFFYLLRVNGWAACGLLLLLSLIDWHPMIARHNLEHAFSAEIDIEYLLSLNDHALPVLLENQPTIYNQLPHHKTWLLTFLIQTKPPKFINEFESHTWLSWNYSDYKVYDYLKKQNQLTWNTQKD